MGHDNANCTMLRRSVQLLLRPESDHFEGSMHLVSDLTELKEGEKGEFSVGGGGHFF